MAKFIAIALCLCLAQVAFARVVREAPAQTDKVSEIGATLFELGNNVKDAFVTFNTRFLDSLGFKSTDEVIEEVKTQTKNYVGKLETVRSSLEAEVKKGSAVADDVFKSANAKVLEITKFLEEKNPEMFGEAKKYQAVVESKLKEVLGEADKLKARFDEQQEPIAKKVNESVEQVYQITLETLKKINTDLEGKKQ
jgi:hypothetical protein